MDELKVIPEFEVEYLQVPDTVATTLLLFSVETAFKNRAPGAPGPPKSWQVHQFRHDLQDVYIPFVQSSVSAAQSTYGHSMMFAHDCCSS